MCWPCSECVGRVVLVCWPCSEWVFCGCVVQGGDVLDAAYAVDCEVRVARCVEDFCFPMHCSRAERRKLLSLAVKGTDCTH